MDGFDANNDGDFNSHARDVARDNLYNITVRATERAAIGGGPSISADLDVAVRVTNRDEPGTVTLQWLQPEVGTPIMASVTDPDDSTDGTIFGWYRAKVDNPDLTPDFDIPSRFFAEWEDLKVSDSSYTPVGDPENDDTVIDKDEGRSLLAWAHYNGKDAVAISAIRCGRTCCPQTTAPPTSGTTSSPLRCRRPPPWLRPWWGP